MPVIDLLYVSFEQSLSFDSSLAILEEFSLTFVDSVGSDHRVLIASVSDTESTGPLDYANAIQIIPEVRWSQPVFCVDYTFGSMPNDPYFQHQYYLHNTGQFGGNQEVDIDIDSAWLFPLNDSLFVVAVIDDGVESHPDLVQNRLLPGYDFVGPNTSLNPPRRPDANPSPGPARYHGMASAGIIAAAHNSIGVAGVHGGCRILPVKIADDFGRLLDGEKGGHEVVRDAINFAADSGAEVVSCSWETGSPIPQSIVQDEIINAMDCDSVNDRPTLFVFMAGNRANDSSFQINFPANMSGVLTVGAVSKHGERWNYSCFGPSLEIMAPSGDDNQFYWNPGDQWTLDRAGFVGWNPAPPGEWDDPSTNVDYTGRMGGTSGAVPQVAGTLALLLSRRPGLNDVNGQICDPTWPEIAREIVCSTATDIGQPGWDNTTGFGILNSFRALLSISHGDVDNDGVINSVDVVKIIDIAFRGGVVASLAWHPALADLNCDGVVCNGQDVVHVVNVAFRGYPLPDPCYRFNY